MTTDAQAMAWIRQITVAIELAGVLVIALAVAVTTAMFLASGASRGRWREAYEEFRANLGRGILLGLEFLVGADIIATVTAPPTFERVGLLAIVVVIRTFLSFALETEITGTLPWRRDDRPGRKR